MSRGVRNGRTAYVRDRDHTGGRVTFEIHHSIRIADGGGVYDIDNLVVVTPNLHIEIHRGGN
ncbi:HNH endonuclease signature motif containing protein [Pseudomonas sp.]|uniref:HNH endonuclease signature motif containing protein n=1 Tax=Pseudomonas sp. TaxID=306 RepID=UPI00345D0F08